MLLSYPHLSSRQDIQIFSLATVLITSYESREGIAKGLIVNYPLLWKYVDVRESLALNALTSVFDANLVYRGGPVETNNFWLLHRHGNMMPSSTKVLPNVYIDTDLDAAADLGDVKSRIVYMAY